MSRLILTKLSGRIVTWIVLLSALVAVPLVVASPQHQDTFTELIYGQTVDNRIDSTQPSVFYTFSAQKDDTVTITMVVSDGELDPFIVLNTPERTPLATDDNSGGNLNARLTVVIPAAGEYVIQATHAGGVPPESGGSFSLNLTVAIDNAAGTVTPATPDSTSTPAEPATTIAVNNNRVVKLQPGATVQDSLTNDAALRFFWFETQAGDQLAFTPTQGAEFQPLLTLYDAGLNELAQSVAGEPLSASTPQAGIVFLAVSPSSLDRVSGDYGFSFDYFPNPASSGNFLPIAYGENQAGTVDDAVSAVTYRFAGTAGDTITIAMNRTGGDLDSYLYLLDSAGQLLFEDNDSGSSAGDAQLTYTLPESASYLIMATRLGQTQGTTSGSYLLSLQSDSPAEVVETSPAPAIPTEFANLPQINYGETVEGTISNAKYVDFYVFLGTAGDEITVEMLSPTIDEPSGLDPLLILLDSERIPLAENDDIEDGIQRESRIVYTLPATAYYAVVATRYEQEAGITSGPYSLTLTGPGGLPDSSATDTADALLVERLITSTLESDAPQQATFGPGAAELYTFAAVENDLITITATADDDANTTLILVDENLNEIAATGTSVLTDIAIPKSGTYALFVAPKYGPASQATGGYTLALTQSAATSTPEPVVNETRELVYGDVVNGTVDDVISSQTYTFTAVADERVRITMEATPGSELDCYLELQDANGSIVDANDDIDPGIIRDSQLVVDIAQDGTYTIIASRYVGIGEPTTSGSYRLTLELIDESAVSGVSSLTTPIAYGQTEVDELNDDQYLVFYVFDGEAGDVVTIEVEHLSGNLDSVLHLYRSEGDGWAQIASNDDSLTGGTYAPLLNEITLPQSGKYLIALSRYGMERETSFGTFALTVTKAP